MGLKISAVAGQSLDQIEARDDADQPLVFDDGQRLDVVIREQTRGHGDMVFGRHGKDFPRHDLRGRAALGLVRLGCAPAKHRAVEVLLPDRFARLQPLVGGAMDQITLGHDAEQTSLSIGDRNAVDAVFNQDAGDFRHSRLGRDLYRVWGHQVANFHGVLLPDLRWCFKKYADIKCQNYILDSSEHGHQ
uniref:Uncharacterized protein n=2 Tax=Acinetobacter TaxID=469 RepID=A0A7S9H9I1_ACIJO|nr:hypothetical protein 12CE1_00032 [Acinetobacter lwoffii]QPG01501.1 hypothetical protein E10B_00187 [Acinetobacter johnsonii]QPG01689.1 hypothetical protein 1BD1_00122 [Acinetobacter sp. TTH0-4]